MLKISDIKINPAIDFDHYAAILADKKRVQIPNFFTEETADLLHKLIIGNQTWFLAYNEFDNYYESPKADLDKAPAHIKSQFMQSIYKRAVDNFQYVFWQYFISQAVQNNEEPGHPLHALHHWGNSEGFLNLMRSLTQEPKVKWSDVFISKYDPGHFLTKHDDTHKKNDRVVAYTIGMTKNWDANWGGHLAFLDATGNVTEGLIPEFNTLNVFHNPQDHMVQIVGPNAGSPRYSILGWANR